MKSSIRPEARTSALVVRRVEGETLVYDRDRDRAHCLNATAAAVWKRCDGGSTVAEIARVLSADLGAPVSEEVVELALEQLGRSHLLVEAPPRAPHGMTRRQLARKVGVAAAVALPAITSLTAPAQAQVQSCAGTGQPCQLGTDCCPGLACTTSQTCQPL